MVWATNALPRNERLPGVVVERPWPTTTMGSTRGARGVTWNFGESPPTIVMV